MIARLGWSLLGPRFPAPSLLHHLRKNPQWSLLVAIAEREILGVLLAEIAGSDGTPVGKVHQLWGLGPAAAAIELALLTRLEEKWKVRGILELQIEILEQDGERMNGFLRLGYDVASAPAEKGPGAPLRLAKKICSPDPPWVRGRPSTRQPEVRHSDHPTGRDSDNMVR